MDDQAFDRIGTQEEFDEYINHLAPKTPCKHMVSTVVNLCTRPELSCPYRGDEIYSFAHGPKKECKRPDILRMKEILGARK